MALLKSLTVEPYMFLCMNAFFLNMVTLPQMILENVCLRNHKKTKCLAMFTGSLKEEYDKVLQETSYWFGGLIAVVALVIIIVLPYVAAVSDRLGRHKALALIPVLQLLQAIVYICIIIGGLRFPTLLILIAALISSFFGDASGLYVITYSYIADITAVKNRTLRINLLEASSLVSGLTSTLSSGFIIERFHYLGIYVVIIIVDAAALLYLLLFIKPVNKPTNAAENAGNAECQDVCSASIESPETMVSSDTRQCALNGGEAPELEAPNNNSDDERFPAKTAGERSSDGLIVGRQDDESFEPANNKESKAGTESLLRADDGKENVFHNNGNDEWTNSKGAGAKLVVERSNEEKKSWMAFLKDSSPFHCIKKARQVLEASGNLRQAMLLFLLMFFVGVSYSAEMAVIVLYLKNSPFLFSAREIGYFLAYLSGLNSIVGLVICNTLLTRVFKLTDLTLVLFSSSIYLVYLVLLGFTNSTLMMYLIQLLHGVSALSVSTIRSMVSKTVDNSSVGLIFAVLLMIETVSVLIGVFISPIIYANLLPVYPGGVFFITAGVMLVATSVALYLCIHKKPIQLPIDDSS